MKSAAGTRQGANGAGQGAMQIKFKRYFFIVVFSFRCLHCAQFDLTKPMPMRLWNRQAWRNFDQYHLNTDLKETTCALFKILVFCLICAEDSKRLNVAIEIENSLKRHSGQKQLEEQLKQAAVNEAHTCL